MELKDFVKGIIFDVTNAIKKCQDEVDMELLYLQLIERQKERQASRS